MRLLTRKAVLASCTAAVIGGALGANFAVSAAVHSDTTGVAGYYKNAGGNWRYRDVRGQFTVTANDEQLGNTAAGDGAVGGRLCNPNTGFAVDVGVIWTGSAFEAAYGDGTVSGSADPCVTAPEASAPVALPGTVNANGIHIGDVIQFEVYYNPRTHWVTFTVSNLTTDFQSKASLDTGYKAFYEAGLGVFDANAAVLVPPVSNVVAVFTNARVTNYNHRGSSTSLLTGGETVPVSSNNGSSVPVVVPSALNAAGNSFVVSAGVSS